MDDEVDWRLRRVSAALGEDLRDEVLLVGGLAPTTYGLARTLIRSTKDVDLVVLAQGYTEWAAWGGRLRGRGFREDARGEHIARWLLEDSPGDAVPVDVVPTPFEDVGHNRWYRGAFDAAVVHPQTRLRVIAPVWFLATKLAAWNDRGVPDPRISHDLEDIINVLVGLPKVWHEIGSGSDPVHRFVRFELDQIAGRPDASELVHGMLPPDAASQELAAPLLTRMRSLRGIRGS